MLEVGDESFSARLIDKTEPGPREEATFDVDDVPTGDVELLETGAVFYWTIGYLISAFGQQSRISMLRFRRIPRWTEEELDAAQQRAAATGELLDWR